MNKTQWTWLIWVILSFGSFFVLEFTSIFDDSLETSALTNVVVWGIPWYIFMPSLTALCIWLLTHFGKYYASKQKRNI